MAKIFKDIDIFRNEATQEKITRERPITVELEGESCILTLEDAYGIVPALHYVESHPEVRAMDFEILPANGKIIAQEGDKVEIFAPDLVYDHRHCAYGYINYNFILLNNMIKHPISRIIKEFSEFLSEIKNPKKRRVKIMDMPPAAYPSLSRVAKAKEHGSGEFYCMTTQLLQDGCPEAAYIHAERFSSGLRNRMGVHGRMKESPLEERLVIG